MKRLALLAGSLTLAACAAAAPPAGGSPRPASSPDASPVATRPGQIAPVTLVTLDSTSPNGPSTLHFLLESGIETGHLQLSAGSRVLAIGGRRIFVATTSGGLQALTRDGNAQTLDSSVGQYFGGGVVVTRDGKRWAWVAPAQVNGASHSVLKVAGEGVTPRVIMNHTDTKAPLAPFAFVPNGIYVNPLPMDANGYFPFQGPVILGLMERIEPATGASTAVSLGDCTFSDVSDAGVIACYLHATKPTLRLVYSPGNLLDLTLATPRFNFIGDAYFSRDSTMLTVAGATGVGMPAELSGGIAAKPEVYGVDLVRVRDGSIGRFGPTGTRVAMGEQSWLPDGKLVLWRPMGAAGGNPGLYVLDPSGSGSGSLIATTGQPIGYLTP